MLDELLANYRTVCFLVGVVGLVVVVSATLLLFAVVSNGLHRDPWDTSDEQEGERRW